MISRILRLDPLALEKLGQLSGKAFEWVIEDVGVSLFILPSAEGLLFRSKITGTADARLMGPLAGFVRLGLAKGDMSRLIEQKIRLEGDVDAAREFQHIMQNLNLDFEEVLSHYVGDVMAQRLGDGVRLVRSQLQSAAESLRLNLKTYLHYESDILVPTAEMDRFQQEVIELRQATDRLAARLMIYSQDPGVSS
jgi:ubiquinone biosynthesis protein UbiJ